MHVPVHVAEFWRSFVRARAGGPTPRFFEAFHFDDNQHGADALALLVLAGTKRATAGLAWAFEAAATPLPKPGDFSVVTDWARRPLCVIETQRVDVVRYDEVSAEFAATEGEGDGSLASWRTDHWAYFGRVCQRLGRSPDAGMPVVCERFHVVFRAPAA